MTECAFCESGRTRPHYDVHAGPTWSVAHVHRRWPAGSVFVFANVHTTFVDAPAALWASAAPVFAAVSRALVTVAGAERVYMLAFSENSEHLHMLFVPKRAEDAARHARRGVPLLQAYIDDELTFDEARASVLTAELRRVLPEYLAVAEREPERAGPYDVEPR